MPPIKRCRIRNLKMDSWNEVRKIASLILNAAYASSNLTTVLRKALSDLCQHFTPTQPVAFRPHLFPSPPVEDDMLVACVVLKLSLLLESKILYPVDLSRLSYVKPQFDSKSYDEKGWKTVNDVLLRVSMLSRATIRRIRCSSDAYLGKKILYDDLTTDDLTTDTLTDKLGALSIGTLGSYPCGRSDCEACKTIKPTRTIVSKTNGIKIVLKERLTCSDTNVIYVGECEACGMQYVGKTTQRGRDRVVQHLHNLRIRHSGGIPRHMMQTHGAIEGLHFTFVESIKNGRTLSELEAYWIDLLDTMKPKGMNLMAASKS